MKLSMPPQDLHTALEFLFYKKADSTICPSFTSNLLTCFNALDIILHLIYFLYWKCSRMSLDVKKKIHSPSPPPRELKGTDCETNANIQLTVFFLWMNTMICKSVKWNVKRANNKSSFLNQDIIDNSDSTTDQWWVIPLLKLVKYLLTDFN